MALDRKGDCWVLTLPADPDLAMALMQFNLLGLYEEKFEVMTQRHRKYGAKNISEEGLYGIVVRVKDKLSRLLSVDPTEEDSKFDAALDGANYLDIAALVLSDRWEEKVPLDAPKCGECGRPKDAVRGV